MIDRARPVEARRARHVAADHGDRAARGREPGIGGAEEGDDGRPERRGGRLEARGADVDRDPEALDEPHVFVHLVETGLGQGNRLGEEPAPPTHGEADPPARSPVERRRRRLERGRQEHRGRAAEAPYGVGGGEPPAPRARIRDEDVGERLIAQDRRPRARQQEPFAVERLAERANGGPPPPRGPPPVPHPNDPPFGPPPPKAAPPKPPPPGGTRRAHKTRRGRPRPGQLLPRPPALPPTHQTPHA